MRGFGGDGATRRHQPKRILRRNRCIDLLPARSNDLCTELPPPDYTFAFALVLPGHPLRGRRNDPSSATMAIVGTRITRNATTLTAIPRTRKATAPSTLVLTTTATAPMTHARHPLLTIVLPSRSITITHTSVLARLRHRTHRAYSGISLLTGAPQLQ